MLKVKLFTIYLASIICTQLSHLPGCDINVLTLRALDLQVLQSDGSLISFAFKLFNFVHCQTTINHWKSQALHKK